ncbi:unnamed protein product [Caenorhabditis brenneri]
MSLSRPATFPLLKLPWLCVKCVFQNWRDIFDILCFALTSKRARRIVKIFKISLNRIEVNLAIWHTRLGNSDKNWRFNHVSWFEEHYQHLRENHIALHKKPPKLETCFFSRTKYTLNSYTLQNLRNASKIAMEFLNEVFNCSVERVDINLDNSPGNIAFKSTVNMCIKQNSTHPLGYAQSQKLNLLLKNLEVTDTCTFRINSTEKGFYVDPKLFKCRELVFGKRSANWVTREILLQFEVPRLNFYDCPFSGQDILSFVTNWFHFDKKLEYFYIEFRSRQFSLENFQTEELNPVPFSGRYRSPPFGSFRYVHVDFSKGLEIVRHDGLKATIHVTGRDFLFYIWHNQ